MLRTNSKKAKENIKQYIMDYTDDIFQDEIDYCEQNNTELKYKNINNYFERCDYLYNRFLEEKVNNFELRYHKYNYYAIFEDWSRGLPCNGLFCYWYNREAKKDLMIILEETEEEANKYTEEEAEILLTKLLYREIVNNKNKYNGGK